MNIDSYASIAQIIEAVVLIASVFYLSLQIKQANQISRSETRRTMLKMDIEDISVGRDNPEIILNPSGKYYALLIGNSNYAKWASLTSPKNDVNAIAKILKNLTM